MNTVDLVAIVPFYVEILMQALASTAADGEAGGFSSQSLRAVRLVRVFRLFKIGRHVSWLHVFADTYVASLPPLVMIVFVISIVMVFLASLVHTVEASAFDFEARMWLGPDGVPSAVASIPDGFWFAIVTMTTVGYGDITPNTPLGKLVGMIGSLVGIIVLAVPISVISLNFHDKYEAQERKNEQKHASKARLASLRKAITKDRLDRKVAKQAEGGGGADIEAAAAAAATATANAPRGGEEKKDAAGFRTVVSLMHAAAERAVLSMNNDTVNVLTTEEHNRLDMKHEIKSMLEQWEPYKRVALIKRSQSAMML
jgi:voltage-gated potassium channel Kch